MEVIMLAPNQYRLGRRGQGSGRCTGGDTMKTEVGRLYGKSWK